MSSHLFVGREHPTWWQERTEGKSLRISCCCCLIIGSKGIGFSDQAIREFAFSRSHDGAYCGVTRHIHHCPKHIQNPIRCDDQGDRKSTRLNSSHVKISYAVFCLKKKK